MLVYKAFNFEPLNRMLCLLSLFCIFLPYSKTTQSAIKTLSIEEIKILSKETKVCAIGLPHKGGEEIIKTVTAAAVHFNNKVRFCYLDEESTDLLSKDLEISLPAFFLFTEGYMYGSYIYPELDSTFLYQIRIFVDPLPDAVQSVKDLNSKLGGSPFSILATEKMVGQAILLQSRAGSQMGPITVIKVSDQVLINLGIEPTSMALFRREDMNIIPIDFDVEALYEKSYPVYRNLLLSDLQDPDKYVFCLVADNLKNEYIDFLFEMGTRFSDFIVGYAGEDVSPYVDQLVQAEANGITRPYVAVVSLEKGLHYPTHQYFTQELLAAPFFADKWIAAGTKLLSKIQSGEIQIEYLSEEIPPNATEGAQKLVGETYTDFVNDPSHDVIVLYKRENCPHCVKFFPIFNAFADECRENKLDGLRFGFIDITKNSAKKPYPYMGGVPHIHIFPAKNKTNDNPLRGGRDRDNLIRFIKRYGSFEMPFEAPPLDKGSVAMEFLNLLFNAKSMPQSEQIKLFEFMNDVGPEIGLNAGNDKKDEL